MPKKIQRTDPLTKIFAMERRLEKILPKTAQGPTKVQTYKRMSLNRFIPAITPKFHSPVHLAPIVEVLEKIRRGERVNFTFSCPPRHGKTELLAHCVALMLVDDPAKRVIYCSYSEKLARRFSRMVRQLCINAGVELQKNMQTQLHWETTRGGGLLCSGIGGGITGFGADCLIIDDIHKDRAQAESEQVREQVVEWFRGVAFTRLEQTGSCIVVATRWVPEDLIGTLIGDGWQHIKLAAIIDEGKETERALWEKVRSLAYLKETKETVGRYEWSSLYQGDPVPKGGSVFHGNYPHYQIDPELIIKTGINTKLDGMRLSIGVDFAYSAKTRSDYSVAVVMGEREGIFYILDLIRQQVEAPVFGAELRPLSERYGCSQINAYIFGTEKGVIDFLRQNHQVKLNAKQHRGDKFSRAQPLAAAWNAGKIRVPSSAPWLNALVSEVLGFTGLNDRHDDQVDALAAAFDALYRPPVPRGMLTQSFGLI